ncbi:hypothetical protein HDU97_003309 [Phlyctochytrium planicorne]|nr:hypothetical protein HDU97_003309 [Phlyctochytrium planicorne]
MTLTKPQTGQYWRCPDHIYAGWVDLNPEKPENRASAHPTSPAPSRYDQPSSSSAQQRHRGNSEEAAWNAAGPSNAKTPSKDRADGRPGADVYGGYRTPHTACRGGPVSEEGNSRYSPYSTPSTSKKNPSNERQPKPTSPTRDRRVRHENPTSPTRGRRDRHESSLPSSVSTKPIEDDSATEADPARSGPGFLFERRGIFHDVENLTGYEHDTMSQTIDIGPELLSRAREGGASSSSADAADRDVDPLSVTGLNDSEVEILGEVFSSPVDEGPLRKTPKPSKPSSSNPFLDVSAPAQGSSSTLLDSPKSTANDKPFRASSGSPVLQPTRTASPANLPTVSDNDDEFEAALGPTKFYVKKLRQKIMDLLSANKKLRTELQKQKVDTERRNKFCDHCIRRIF